MAKHAAAEVAKADLPRLQAELADRVAYGEMSFTGKIPVAGLAGEELVSLIKELQALGWIELRNAVKTSPR